MRLVVSFPTTARVYAHIMKYSVVFSGKETVLGRVPQR
jgi:hypothetical protein